MKEVRLDFETEGLLSLTRLVSSWEASYPTTERSSNPVNLGATLSVLLMVRLLRLWKESGEITARLGGQLAPRLADSMRARIQDREPKWITDIFDNQMFRKLFLAKGGGREITNDPDRITGEQIRVFVDNVEYTNQPAGLLIIENWYKTVLKAENKLDASIPEIDWQQRWSDFLTQNPKNESEPLQPDTTISSLTQTQLQTLIDCVLGALVEIGTLDPKQHNKNLQRQIQLILSPSTAGSS